MRGVRNPQSIGFNNRVTVGIATKYFELDIALLPENLGKIGPTQSRRVKTSAHVKTSGTLHLWGVPDEYPLQPLLLLEVDISRAVVELGRFD